MLTTETVRGFDLATAMGARAELSQQMLVVYIPDRDRGGTEIGTQRKWVLEAAHLLAEIGGGVTIEPPCEGGWHDPRNGQVVWERPVLVRSYLLTDRFIAAIPRLRELLHRLGQETGQGEIVFEFDGVFFRIEEFAP